MARIDICIKDAAGQYPSYAWPGGYPLFYICADCGVLCADCANKNKHLDTPDDKQWHIVAYDINYEDTSLYCDNCNQIIECAYGNN